MNDQDKTRYELIRELDEMRRRLKELELKGVARDKVRGPEESYRNLIENLKDLVFTIDQSGSMTFVSQSAEDVLGFKSSEGLGKNVIEFVPVEDRHRVIETISKGMEGEKIVKFQTPVIKKSGERVTLELTVSRLWKDGDIAGAVAIARDISDRKRLEAELIEQRERLEEVVAERTRELLELNEALERELAERQGAERALAESERKYRTLIQTSPDAIVVTDLETKVVLANRQALKIFGARTEAEVIGLKGLDLVAPAERERALKDMAKTMSADNVQDLEYQFVRLDGGQFPAEMSISAVRDEQGRPRSFLAGIRDVTVRKQLEEQLHQAMKMETVGLLAGGVAHDFNNALTPMLSLSDLMLKELRPSDPMYGDVLEIRRAGERCAELTRQLLAFGRRQTLEMSVFQLNDVVANMDKMLSRIIGEDIELVEFLAPELGNVRADVGRLEQVIANLAINARDAMLHGGKLTIETRNVALDEEYAAGHLELTPGEYVMLAITDTGTGMDEVTRAHIFEPFFTTKEKGRGSGLGLSSVYGIVRQCGGHIWVYSEPGAGSTFKIYFPRVLEEAEPLSPPSETAAGPYTGSETILLVEDDDGVRMVAERILTERGYQVLTAGSAEEAMELMDRNPAPLDLLVTDVVMPGMSGKKLADRVMAARPEIKVLFVSGYTDNSIVHHGIIDEGTPFLQKPFTVESLSRKVREVLDSA